MPFKSAIVAGIQMIVPWGCRSHVSGNSWQGRYNNSGLRSHISTTKEPWARVSDSRTGSTIPCKTNVIISREHGSKNVTSPLNQGRDRGPISIRFLWLLEMSSCVSLPQGIHRGSMWQKRFVVHLLRANPSVSYSQARDAVFADFVSVPKSLSTALHVRDGRSGQHYRLSSTFRTLGP